MTDHSDLIERARAYRPYNHLNDGDLVRQLLDALSSQSLSLSEAREEIERLRSELDRRSKDWAMMRGDNYAFNAVQKLNERATAAERLLTTFVAHYPMGINPFLDDAFRAARSALENSKARLADATNDPADSDLSSLRKGAEVDMVEAWNSWWEVRINGQIISKWPSCESAAIIVDRIRSALVSGSREDGA